MSLTRDASRAGPVSFRRSRSEPRPKLVLVKSISLSAKVSIALHHLIVCLDLFFLILAGPIPARMHFRDILGNIGFQLLRVVHTAPSELPSSLK